MRNRIVNNTTKPKSLARIEREERESKPQRSTVTGRASASPGATIRHFSAKPANQTSSTQSSHTLKPLPQIEREERESMHRSSYSSATGHASGGVGNIFSRVNHDSTLRTTDTTRNTGHTERAERFNVKPVNSPPTPSRNQSAEAALLAKLPSDFPVNRWDNMSTREQSSIMRRSGLTVQEQWKLLNATTPMKALSVLNAVQTGLNNGTLTSREAAALTGGSLRYAETKKQLASADASVLPPLQKRLLHGELEDTIDSIRAKAEGIDTDTPQATPNPLASLLPQPGPTPPAVTPNPLKGIADLSKRLIYVRNENSKDSDLLLGVDTSRISDEDREILERINKELLRGNISQDQLGMYTASVNRIQLKAMYKDPLKIAMTTSLRDATWGTEVINNQKSYSTEPGTFGSRGNLADNGCGFMAINNTNQILGTPTNFKDTVSKLNANSTFTTLLGGTRGMNPLVVGDYYRSKGYDVELYPNISEVPMTYDAYIMLYAYKAQDANHNDTLGAHYIALSYDEASEMLTAYNLSGNKAVKSESFSDYLSEDTTLASIVWGIRKSDTIN